MRLGELGSNISGQIAAGLALLSKEYALYDKTFADSCLLVAKELYDFAKNLKLGKPTYGNNRPFVYNKVPDGWSSAAYNGNNESHDDLGLAAIALHYASYDPANPDMSYLNDAVEEKSYASAQEPGPGFFRGGWFALTRDGMRKSMKNTSWANAYTYTLYAFYKLLLNDDETSLKYGISPSERLWYAENVIYMLAENLSNVASSGGSSITIPGRNNSFNISFGSLWYNMQTDQTWIYNRYQAGNIFEVFAYADVAKDLEGVRLPQKGQQAWKSAEMRQLGINQMNYMLGVNPWDVSFMLGVGDKNDAHPHHRASNPEGKNMPGAAYVYNPPVGALFGGVTPGDENSWSPSTMSWEDYHLSETCIDGTAMFLAAGAMATRAEDLNRAPSQVNVEIRYVGYDSAIVNVIQDVRGQSMILYSENETGPFNQMAIDTVPGVKHTIHMKGLKNGTTYYFKVVSINSRSEKYATKWLVDSTNTPFYFTTLASEPPSADIQNVKVCNLSADSAEIMWFTPNGQYESKIYWDTVLTTHDKMKWNSGDANADVSGIPTNFHYVKIGGLKEKTTYYYVVESNGVRRSVDDKGNPLKFTTPVTQYDFEVRTYQYEFTGLDFINLNIYNNEDRSFDSLTLRLYLTAREDQVAECALMIDLDICQAYDEAGFNKPCETDSEIRGLLRGAMPVKLEDTYDAATGMYSWYYPIPLGSTTIKSSSRMRMDLGFSVGLYQNGKCAPLRSTPQKRMSATTGDWSWAPHTREEDGADYEGMLDADKDFGDSDFAPVNPYIVVYRKDEFVSGFSPSYQEMTTKRANYEMTVSLDAPFNVSNGSYIQIDSTTSTMRIKGNAFITESGFVTSIWVNGVALSKEQLKTAAIYNKATGKFDLDIPVKLAIGTNKVDLTIFAGPDPECEACTENGGCAFVNRSYFIQYSKGDRTAGILTLLQENGSSVSSPAATDGSAKFFIVVKDKDNRQNKSIQAKLVNSRTGDTTTVALERVNETTGEFKSELLIPIDSKDASYPKISFFGGDTLTVIYMDAEDSEDVVSQSFYANPTHPVPQLAALYDENCNAIGELLVATFGGSSFGDEISLDSALIVLDSTEIFPKTEFMMIPNSVEGMTASFALDESKMPETGSVSGNVTFYMTEKGTVTMEKIALSDKIAPQLLSVTLLENEEPRSAQDTLKIAFTEPVVLPSKTAWPLRITDGKTEISQSGILVRNVSSTDNGKSWLYVIEGNVNGEVVKKGFLSEISEAFMVSDVAMNGLSNCSGPKTIVESVRPVPITFAKISDETGDGKPDEIYMEFEKVLRDKDMLDSFEVYWGNPAVYHSFVKPSSGWNVDTIRGEKTAKPVTAIVDSSMEEKKTIYKEVVGQKTIWCDQFEVVFDSAENVWDSVKVQDSLGNTMQYACGFQDSTVNVTKIDTIWNYVVDTTGYDTIQKVYSAFRVNIPKGVYNQLTYGAKEGKGSVMPRKGEEGGFFDKIYSLNDDCPPVILSASWSARETNNGQMDLLEVHMSEPLDSVSGNSYYIERRRGSSGGVFLQPYSIMNTDGLKKVTFLYQDDAEDAVWFGDSIRLIPDSTRSYYRDKARLFPGRENPWVPVTGVIDNVKFKVKMESSVTKKDNDIEPYAGQKLSEEEHFRLSVANSSGEKVIASGSETLEKVDMSVAKDYKHAGPVFKLDITLPEVHDKTELGEYKRHYRIDISLMLFNNQGSYVNEMNYQFDLDELIEFVSANNVLTLYLEWCSKEEAPVSLEGRKVGSGAFVAKFDFEAKALYVAEHPDEGDNRKPIKANKSSMVTFGFRR